MKNLVATPSKVNGLPRRVVPQLCSITSLPESASETFPRSVPQLRQNLPVSGFSIPHFGQNIVLTNNQK
jgi:hypothetical protein